MPTAGKCRTGPVEVTARHRALLRSLFLDSDAGATRQPNDVPAVIYFSRERPTDDDMHNITADALLAGPSGKRPPAAAPNGGQATGL